MVCKQVFASCPAPLGLTASRIQRKVPFPLNPWQVLPLLSKEDIKYIKEHFPWTIKMINNKLYGLWERKHHTLTWKSAFTGNNVFGDEFIIPIARPWPANSPGKSGSVRLCCQCQRLAVFRWHCCITRSRQCSRPHSQTGRTISISQPPAPDAQGQQLTNTRSWNLLAGRAPREPG